MRHVLCAVTLLVGAAVYCHARSSLTLLVQFDSHHSQASFQAMRTEVQRLMKNVDVDWRLLDQVKPGESFPDLVVVKFKGSCEMKSVPEYLIDERGPLGFTYTADGVVLPFSEVECDRVRQTVFSAMGETDNNKADLLLGRALGRVLAHELHHVLEHTTRHAKEGVNRRALSGAQLISPTMRD